jgi:hypothetical protein
VCVSVVNPGLEVRSCGNTVLLKSANSCITMLSYFDDDDKNNIDNDMPLLCFCKSFPLNSSSFSGLTVHY